MGVIESCKRILPNGLRCGDYDDNFILRLCESCSKDRRARFKEDICNG